MPGDLGLLNYVLGPAVVAAVVAYGVKVHGERQDLKRRHRALIVGLSTELYELRRIHTEFRSSLDLAVLGKRIDEDETYVPFTTADPMSVRKLFEEFKTELPLLDEAVLKSVVQVYGEDGRTQTMVLDMRSPDFKSLEGYRKKKYLELLLVQSDKTIKSADVALSLLEAASNNRR